MNLKLLLFVSIFLFVLSCATAPNSLPEHIKKQIRSTDIVLFISQDELKILETGGSGLDCIKGNTHLALDAICLTVFAVGTAMHYKAKSKITSINKSLQNYDFRTAILNTLSIEIPKIANIKPNIPIQLEKDILQKQVIFTQSKADSVLFMDISYHLGILEKLVITANLEMYSKSKDLLKQVKEKMDNTNPVNSLLKSVNLENPITNNNKIYKNIFTFTSEQSITQDNVKDYLNEGINSIAKMIVSDINNP